MPKFEVSIVRKNIEYMSYNTIIEASSERAAKARAKKIGEDETLLDSYEEIESDTWWELHSVDVNAI